MLEGILTGAAMASLQGLFEGGDASRRLVDGAMGDLEGLPAGPRRDATGRFLGELRQFLGAVPAAASPATAGGATTGGLRLVQIDRRALRADHPGPRSSFEVTFPQGILWGVIGCALGFALSLVQERTRGTLVRLRASPLAPRDVLLGKGLACLVAILAVEALLLGLGWAAFGVRPSSWGLLAAAAISLAACFVGIMMLVAVLGKTEQSASGLGWAAMMPLAMLGGGMVPLFAMPAWMQAAGVISPVRWGILALEGAIWRGFGPAELALPCAVLWAVGVAGFTIGAWRYGASAGDVGG